MQNHSQQTSGQSTTEKPLSDNSRSASSAQSNAASARVAHNTGCCDFVKMVTGASKISFGGGFGL